ncbi:MAE_28990/MAE_18760 family HEPN-like nuclease [Halobacteriovorax sp. JY17]|uniref:MAE_28990/MAE_18760 family HEPN-like nuclease n=1 Tax=Halobacteriovorax sp. JY17 TaxID=2014617 RepID=UPI000C6AE101|nr:MAE_28990/MAE_18760 family HEPN-like nuclease [Halobacteriovorax sp. JY17]PIK15106.1 MAG: hypothetical protein CES88_12295 [Halobacteriovorax sp. JY17]
MHRVIEEIQIGNEWREKEFAKFKANQKGVDETLWCRMCTPMIYAHWEGFAKNSLEVMLKHLNSLNLCSEAVNTKILVYSLGDAYKPLSGKQAFMQRLQFTDAFKEKIFNTVSVPSKVNTKSNLSIKVLRELCSIFDFDESKLEAIAPDITRLVKIRNSIAHGENSFVLNQENLNKYITAVQTAIDYLTNEIEVFITNEKYMKLPIVNP